MDAFFIYISTLQRILARFFELFFVFLLALEFTPRFILFNNQVWR